MKIKFPSVHIAESVLSRILDTADALGLGPGMPHQGTPSAGTRKPPAVAEAAEPDPTDVKSAILDVKTLEEPPSEDELPPLEAPAPPDDVLAGILARGDNIINA